MSCPLRHTCPRVPGSRSRSHTPPDFSALNRREWIKTFMLGTATALATGWKATLLADITAETGKGIVALPLASYPALQTNLGSVQIYFASTRMPILVNRLNATTFYAMDSTCTHEGQQVDLYDPGMGTIFCQGHASQYDIQGHLLFPAPGSENQQDLTAFPTEFRADTQTLYVQVPNLPLTINTVQVVAPVVAGTQRLRLVFPVITGATYKLRHQPDLLSPSVNVNFSTTVGGAAGTSQITTPASLPANPTRTMYVDTPMGSARGFYMVELVVTG